MPTLTQKRYKTIYTCGIQLRFYALVAPVFLLTIFTWNNEKVWLFLHSVRIFGLQLLMLQPLIIVYCNRQRYSPELILNLQSWKKTFVDFLFGFDEKYSARHPKAKFWRFLLKNGEISTVKQAIEKHVLLNFVNVSTTLCPRLWKIGYIEW